MTRKEILGTAAAIVTQDREKAEDNFSLIARMWTDYLGALINKARTSGENTFALSAKDVAIMMSLLKIARIATGQPKADSFVDACGYMACAAELAGDKNGKSH